MIMYGNRHAVRLRDWRCIAFSFEGVKVRSALGIPYLQYISAVGLVQRYLKRGVRFGGEIRDFSHLSVFSSRMCWPKILRFRCSVLAEERLQQEEW